MRIVVTGAAGFIGSHLCERLAARGCSVVGVRRKEQNARELAAVDVRAKRLDLASDSLRGALADAAVIDHLAAQAGRNRYHNSTGNRYRRKVARQQCALKNPTTESR